MKLYHAIAGTSVVIATLTFGCTSMVLGRPINSAQVKLIEVGRTTRDDIVGRFGEPYRTTTLDDADVLTYVYVTPDGQSQKLVVSTNGDGVVANYAFE